MEKHNAPGDSNEGEIRRASSFTRHSSEQNAQSGPRAGSLAEGSHADQLGICNILAALLYGVSAGDFIEYTRHERRISEARQLGMYLANICLGIDYETIAHLANRDRTTVRYSIGRVEDRRENPQFDSVLVALETLVGCLQSRAVSDMIENGLNIDYNFVSHVPRAD